MKTSKENCFFKRSRPCSPTSFRNGRNNYSFIQRVNPTNKEETNIIAGKDGVTNSHITCFHVATWVTTQVVFKCNRSWFVPCSFFYLHKVSKKIIPSKNLGFYLTLVLLIVCPIILTWSQT